MSDFTEDPLMTRDEVADLFGVEPKTVTMWARARRIGTVRTLGGHYRFRTSVVRKALADSEVVPTTDSLK